ncbi:thioredoxin [Pseudobacteriovorax antillogorgiicola]|uniref:Thioredoxin n=1 Tax=Pseudobacteriovorax antillogorgiicola TaxID=1513793 RepID=A0A1Y6CKQ5_9BACT|nr:thioredoxin [Pseudobacteriovorax antillogorgiicola]TCS45624.1 thioredoxin [Pseudobacteriovorax antillogorgiicola]SMF72461.1 thioredoxin [Pseudobacteriovorax antillogorgiicola]
MGTYTKAVSEADFEEKVLKANEPVLVDFWAPWCGPCVSIGPALEKLAEEYQGKVTIAKLNVDENPEISAKYGVRSIPYLAMFKNGEITSSVVGAQPPQSLQKMIDESL